MPIRTRSRLVQYARRLRKMGGLSKYRRRRPIRGRAGAGPIKNYYRFKRFCEDTTLINTAPGDIKWQEAPANWNVGVATPDDNGLFQFGGVMKFQLDDIINKSDMTSLFDRYKITGAKITLIPLANQGYVGQSSSGNSNSATIPTITYAVDYDDSALPTSSLTLLEKMDSKVRRLDKPLSIYVKNPKVSMTINSDSGAVSAAVSTLSGFVNTASDDVNFRGLKFYIRDMALPDPGAKLNSLIRVQVKYYMTFKDPQ